MKTSPAIPMGRISTWLGDRHFYVESVREGTAPSLFLLVPDDQPFRRGVMSMLPRVALE